MAVTERLMLPAASLREEIGISGPTVSETIPFRDKVLMKRMLREFGIRVPDFAEFTEAAARKLFEKYPALVVKPRLGAGSESVYLLRCLADLDAFIAAHRGNLAEFEVEAHICGTLFHVDSV